jgi:hypothetical protein
MTTLMCSDVVGPLRSILEPLHTSHANIIAVASRCTTQHAAAVETLP